MKHYTVHGRPDDVIEDAVFVKEGFNWPAFLVPPVWLIMKRQWLWLVLYLLAVSVIGAAGQAVQWSDNASLWLVVALNLLFGLEANDILRRSLRRRGFSFLGPALGTDLEEAELGFFTAAAAGDGGAVSDESEEPGAIADGFRTPAR
jgi:hypothetical protein